MSAAIRTAGAGLALAATLTAQAGQACDATAPSVAAVTQGLALAAEVERRLNASGADVVLLARAGQDLSRWGLRWSHFGLAYRQSQGERAVWRVVHKLNHCGTDEAAVYRQGLGEFFLDQPHRYEAAFVVLAPALQAALLPRLRSNEQHARLNTPHYSMVAYAWGTRYQQSNQWALETMADDGGAVTRDGAQSWLQAQGYRPGVLQIDALTRLGARMTMAHVAFDDHPNAQRFAGRIETVTVESVFRWLQDEGLGSQPQLVR